MSCQLQITIFGTLCFTGQGAGRDLSQPEWLLVDAPPDCVWHQRGHLPGVRQECKTGGQHVHNWHRTQACTQELPACHITLHNQVNCIFNHSPVNVQIKLWWKVERVFDTYSITFSTELCTTTFLGRWECKTWYLWNQVGVFTYEESRLMTQKSSCGSGT